MKREINKTKVIKDAMLSEDERYSKNPFLNHSFEWLIHDEDLNLLDEPDMGEYIQVQEDVKGRNVIIYKNKHGEMKCEFDIDDYCNEEIEEDIKNNIDPILVMENFYYSFRYVNTDYYGYKKKGKLYLKDLISIFDGRFLGQEAELEESKELGVPICPYYYEGEYNGDERMMNVSMYTFDNESLVNHIVPSNGIYIKTPDSDDQKQIYCRNKKGRLKL